MTSLSKKMANFHLLSSVQVKVLVQWGQIRRIRWVIIILEEKVGQILLFYNCPVSQALSCKNKISLLKFTWRFTFKIFVSCHSRDE